jgi:hypothetical protein
MKTSERNLIVTASIALSLAVYFTTRTFFVFVPLFLFLVTSLAFVPDAIPRAENVPDEEHRPKRIRRPSVQSEVIAKRPLGNEVPQNTIVGMAFFQHLSNEKLMEIRNLVEKKMMLFPRLRSKVRQDGHALVFEEVETVEPERHYVFHELPSEAAMLKYIDEKIVPRNFDPEYPSFQWDFFNSPNKDERTMTVFTIHHSLADGYSMNRILNVLLSGPDGETLDIYQPRPASKLDSTWQWIKYMFGIVVPRMKAQLKIYGLVFFHDTNTLLTRYPFTYNLPRRTIFLPRLSLVKLSELRAKLHEQTGVKTTLTDLYLSMVGGAWHRYLAAHSDSNANGAPKVRAWCPFMFHRESSTGYSLHNLWGFVSTRIIADANTNAVDRLIETKKQFDSVKYSPEAVAQLDISGQINVIDRFIKGFMKFILYRAMSHQSMVFTSVPGLQKQGWIGGVPIDEIRCSITLLVPFFSLLSYAGSTCFSMTIDPAKMDGEEFARYMEDELKELGKAVEMSDFAFNVKND